MISINQDQRFSLFDAMDAIRTVKRGKIAAWIACAEIISHRVNNLGGQNPHNLTYWLNTFL